MNGEIVDSPEKKDTNYQINPEVKELIEKVFWAKKQKQKAKPAVIHVDEIASKLAVFYEKIRKIIDWKEEHLLRRSAIERVLKRKLISEISGLSLLPDTNPEKIAEPLINELIRGGHFPNDTIPRSKVDEVEKCLDKYIYIMENHPVATSSQVKKRINLYNWLIEIAACEIEEILQPAWKENFLLNFMTRSMNKRIQLSPDLDLTERETQQQIYIATQRTLFNLDDGLISYHLIKVNYSDWVENNPETYQEFTNQILEIWGDVEEKLNHPLGNKFRNVCEKYDTVYLILGDILEEQKNLDETLTKFNQPSILKNLINKAYKERLSTLKGRLTRAAIYSTLSILVASIVSLFIAEVPLAKLVYGEFRPLAIIVDLLLPAIVMFFLVIIIRLPPEENKEKVIEEVEKVVYPQEDTDVYEIRRHKRSFFARVIITFLYIITTILSIGIVFFLFYIAKVPATSLFVDTLNVSMVVFAGLLIRQRAKELTIEEKTSFWQFILDILSIPVAKLGQWLSKKWQEYNIVSVFLTVLVDMPFSSLIKFIEDWNSFIKEKKAELH
jgi:hypothetical protein